MAPRRNRTAAALLSTLLLPAALGAGVWLTVVRSGLPEPAIYRPEGYGTYAAPEHANDTEGVTRPGKGRVSARDPVEPALSLYRRGDYRQAEAEARRLIERAAASGDPALRREAVRARWVAAFAAARQRELRRAREQFARLRKEAARLGQLDTGGDLQDTPSGASGAGGVNGAGPPRRTTSPGSEQGDRLVAVLSEAGPTFAIQRNEPSPEPRRVPTLEEDAAYQHAVLTAALGDAAAAEAEFIEFMRRYPESPLVHAAIRRIARLHGGDIPPEAEAVWHAAMRRGQKRQADAEREAAMCGPQVLAEALRRLGKLQPSEGRAPASGATGAAWAVQTLARELGTDRHGTTLQALAEAARRRGLSARGLQLSFEELRREMTPRPAPTAAHPAPGGPGGALVLSSGATRAPLLIALMRPGHYVLVESVTFREVRVWDPSSPTRDAPGIHRLYSSTDWKRVWDGIVLELR